MEQTQRVEKWYESWSLRNDCGNLGRNEINSRMDKNLHDPTEKERFGPSQNETYENDKNMMKYENKERNDNFGSDPSRTKTRAEFAQS